jgi:hypothetical protein
MTTITSTRQPEQTADLSVTSGSAKELRWPLLLIALLTAYTGYMIRGSYYFADDFLTFGYAHRLGLSWSLVFLNLFGHVAPTERLLHYLPLSVSPFNYAFAETIILVLYAALMLSFMWVLRELRLSFVVTLTLLFLAGTSTILLNETLYFDQTVFLLPASTFILCVSALFIRWTRSGQAWALYLSWLVFALSFITQERPLVVLVYLVLLRYLVLPYRQAPGGKRRWLADWRIWTPFAAIAAAYVGYYLTIAPHSKTNESLILTFLRLTGQAFMRAVIGIPITNVWTWTTWLELGVVVLIVGGLLVFSPRRQLVFRATVFFIVCFLVNLAPVLHGIGGIIGAGGVAFQVQYYVDALFALGIAVGLICSDWVWQGRAWSARRARHKAEGSSNNGFRWTVIACAAFVVLHIALLPFGVRSINSGNVGQTIGRSWMGNLRHSLAGIDAAHPATVIPLTMPPSFDPTFEAPFNQESSIFPLLSEWHDDDNGPVEVAGPTGGTVVTSAGDSVGLNSQSLAFASAIDLSRAPGPAGESCFRGNGRLGRLWIELPHTVTGGVVAGNVSVNTRQPFTLLPISVDEKSHISVSQYPQTVRQGNSRIFVVFPGRSVATVGFADISPRSHFCIAGLQVGSVLEHFVGTTCQEIDLYGNPKNVVDCGVPWRGKMSSATS